MIQKSDWLEFKNSVAHLTSSRVHKVNNSIGSYDIYKLLRKNKWRDIGQRLTEHQYYSIIRGINNLLADEIINGNDVKFPSRMGTLEIRKYNSSISYDGNKIKTNLPVDWDTTLKLWYEDEEAYNNKTLVRVRTDKLFKINYNKEKANFENKGFYTFLINRDIKKGLKASIKDNKINAYEMGRSIF